MSLPAHAPLSDETLTALRPLARQFPTLDSALGEISRLSAELTLPIGNPRSELRAVGSTGCLPCN